MNSAAVLLVEDDRDQSASIKRALEQHGFETLIIDSETAFRRWARKPPRLPVAVVMDVYIRYGSIDGLSDELPNPQQAGFRCQAILEQTHPEVPVVFYSQFSVSDSGYLGDLRYLKKRAGHRHLCSLLKGFVREVEDHAGIAS
jgi:CheY-like chemotaxis protein